MIDLPQDPHEALARTSQLLNSDFFDDRADDRAITEELRKTTVAVVGDAFNLSSPVGQTLVTMLVACNAMMGFDVVLSIPDVELVAPQPPLIGRTLLRALAHYGADLVPGAIISAEPATTEITYVIGDTPGAPADAIRVWADDWKATVETAAEGPGSRCVGTLPIGAMAAAAAGAAEGLRRILPRMATNLDETLPIRRFHFDLRPVELDLTIEGLDTDPGLNLGSVDFVSAGAITTAAISVLLRIPNLRGALRVIERDRLDVANLNRYTLARRRNLGDYKAELMASFATDRLRIQPRLQLFTEASRANLLPLARRVCVGVDDIPSRWMVQRERPEWLCVAATSHLEVRVSTHIPGQPCAGCAHPTDDPDTRDIPTISWVSLWAGLLQAHALLSVAAGLPPPAASYWCWPFGLGNPHGLVPRPIAARPDCPVRCEASLAHRPH